MATITLHGNSIHTSGELPGVGSAAPGFSLVNGDLETVGPDAYAGKKLVLNIFPSLDTGVCAASVRRFNEEAGKLEDTAVLCISMDLPFAQARFCGAEGLENVVNLSGFRDPGFGKDYGVGIVDGPLEGLYSRAVVVVDASGKVVYTEQVPEIAQEPDYGKALAALGG